MKKNFLFLLVCASLLISCTNQKKANEASTTIDIERCMQNTTTLNVSDLGPTIRYVPLETTDDCLIGKIPIVKVLKRHIVIESGQHCYLFDKEDGSFISAIGHVGQDPEAYNSPFSRTDEKEEFLYFTHQPDQLVKYDMKGNFAGKIAFSSQSESASCYLFTDSEIIGYYNGLNPRDYVLAVFDKEGILQDTIPALLPKTDELFADILNISVTKGTDTYGNWTKTGAIIIDYKNDKRQILAPDATTLWMNNGNIRFKETFIDTIYTVMNGKLLPYITFNTGKWHWPERERMSKNNNSERVFIADVSENDRFVFFQCIKGLYSDDRVLYNGLYNKKTGETKLSKYSDAIPDDLTSFMPFKPLEISTSGEFVSLIEADQITEWLEKHPEAEKNEKLPFLKNFNEEMNPVIVLVE
ncbi:DUF4934 domain-containing protein [Bacteroides sp. OttesenSCG-928-D19]|nr:DUF4934 domain-containing protein [Bacteroides sp. OttesenSCG-928-D19]